MRLASFLHGGRTSYGIVLDHGIVDLGVRLAPRLPTLRALLEADALDEARALAAAGDVDLALDDVAWLPVIPDPGKIFCIGLNYDEHRQETQRDRTEHPSVFMRIADSQVGHGQPMLRPRESTQFDYEGEIAIVIGRGGRRIAPAHAWHHVAGYSCYNDGSVRDWQRHTSQWIPGKNFARTGGFGPWLVTSDAIAPGRVLKLETRVNGVTMQHATTDMLIFPIPRLVAYCSTFAPLAPGDVIVTGTPGGVGSRRTPPVWLREHDVVEVEVSEVGVLRNTVEIDG